MPGGGFSLHRFPRLAAASLRLPIDEKLGFRVAGIAEDGHLLPLTSVPRPVGQKVQCRFFRVPYRPVEIVAVLGQAGQVASSEVAAAAGPVFIVWCRFAKIVLSCPYELSDGVGQVLHGDEVLLRQVAPRAPLRVVACYLSVAVGLRHSPSDRQLVHPTA